jgi:hypothetical protein
MLVVFQSRLAPLPEVVRTACDDDHQQDGPDEAVAPVAR